MNGKGSKGVGGETTKPCFLRPRSCRLPPQPHPHILSRILLICAVLSPYGPCVIPLRAWRVVRPGRGGSVALSPTRDVSFGSSIVHPKRTPTNCTVAPGATHPQYRCMESHLAHVHLHPLQLCRLPFWRRITTATPRRTNSWTKQGIESNSTAQFKDSPIRSCCVLGWAGGETPASGPSRRISHHVAMVRSRRRCCGVQGSRLCAGLPRTVHSRFDHAFTTAAAASR